MKKTHEFIPSVTFLSDSRTEMSWHFVGNLVIACRGKKFVVMWFVVQNEGNPEFVMLSLWYVDVCYPHSNYSLLDDFLGNILGKRTSRVTLVIELLACYFKYGKSAFPRPNRLHLKSKLNQSDWAQSNQAGDWNSGTEWDITRWRTVL